MDNLKCEILAKIPSYTPECYDWHGIEEFENLLYVKNGYTVYGDAIQAALDQYTCVQISKRDTMYLEKPIIMKSGYRLKLDRYQHIANLPDLRTCLIRNEHIVDATYAPVVHDNYDTDISVDGGIWDGGLKATDGEDKSDVIDKINMEIEEMAKNA